MARTRNHVSDLRPLTRSSALAAALVVLPAGGMAAPSLDTAPKIWFEANQGQVDPEVKFVSRGRGYSLFLASDEAVLTAGAAGPGEQGRRSVLRMKLAGAAARPTVTGTDPLPGRSNYFIGKDPGRWRTGVPHYARVRYEGVYRGIDLVYYGAQEGRLEYDFVVAPAADPRTITLQFEGAQGMDLDARGDLVIRTGAGDLRQHRPVAYQDTAQGRRPVAARYVVRSANRIGFEVGAYDARQPLVIDPVLVYSTYLGGSGGSAGNGDRAFSLARDPAGNVYVAGFTDSLDFPTAHAHDATLGGAADAFVAKLNPGGSVLLYATYLGGSGGDVGDGVAVDAEGHAYVTGSTASSDFPVTAGAFQTTAPPGNNAFVAKLSPSGASIAYATYLGGGTDELGQAIAVDALGHAYVTGITASSNFPTVNPLQPALAGGPFDAFVTKMNTDGSGLVYSTFLGGSFSEGGRSIAVDGTGHAYVTGETQSLDLATVNAYQPAHGGSINDAFVAKLAPSGSALVYLTYLGGSAPNEGGRALAVDAAGHAYVTGSTHSTNFPVRNAFQDKLNGTGAAGPIQDGFVAKFDPAGGAVFVSYLGGSNSDEGLAIALDPFGEIYVGGFTASADFPAFGPPQTVLGGVDGFVANVASDGSSIAYATYIGGSALDLVWGIAADDSGSVYVAGETASPDLPTVNAIQPSLGGGSGFDVFVAKLAELSPPLANVSVTKAGTPDPALVGSPLTYTITVANGGPDPAGEVVLTDSLPSGLALVSVTSSQGTCAPGPVVSCSLGTLAVGAAATVTIGVTPLQAGQFINTASAGGDDPDPNPGDNVASATTTVSEPTLPPLFPGGGQRPPDVNRFLMYASPLQQRTDLPAGTTSYSLVIYYGETIDPATFSATLSGAPAGGFVPTPGTLQTVSIPLAPGRNTLVLTVDGTRTDGRTATDQDRLTFLVP